MMWVKHVRVNGVSDFNDTSCQMEALGLLRGSELMYIMLRLTDRGELWGLMDSPANAPYYPGKSKPLIIK
jgi:2,3-bisphosphoglycerate-independent phosphoglycerate mutase